MFSGPFFHAIEQVVFQDKHFVKFSTPEERIERIASLRGKYPYLHATDFTAFESHFTPEIMRALEIPLYKYMLQNYPEAADVIARTLTSVNNIHTRIGMRAQVRGRRMSGDMCTSLGNGWSNYMLASFLISRKGGEFDGVFEGDDGLFSSTVLLSETDYSDLGFTIKIERPEDPLTASFCGIVQSSDNQCIRDPVRFFSKFGWTQSCLFAGPKVMDQLQRGKALSAMYETPACPLITAAAAYVLQETDGCEVRFEAGQYKVIPRTPVPRQSITPATRQLFSQLYGILPETQLILEERIERGDFACLQPHLDGGRDMADYITKFVG